MSQPSDGHKYELWNGKIIVSAAGFYHGDLCAAVSEAIRAFVRLRKLGKICDGQTGFRLTHGFRRKTVLSPDVSFVSQARGEALVNRDKFFEGGPDLTVEVLLTTLFQIPPSALRAADAAKAPNAALAAVEAADDTRVATMKAGNREKLDGIFSDDLHYAHSTGEVDTKSSSIPKLTSGKTKYLNVDYEKRDFTFPVPGVALMTGRVHIRAVSGKTTNDNVLSFLAAWRLEKGQWRFLAWQSCRLPPKP